MAWGRQNGIIDMAIRCKLYELCPSKITFMRVIRTMTQSLGYEVETGNEKFDDKGLPINWWFLLMKIRLTSIHHIKI